MHSRGAKYTGKTEGLSSRSPFSFICDRCSACCKDKVIRVNPYEVMRLSSKLGVSTTDFLARHTLAGGTELGRTEDGACVFVTPKGCAVHEARPLVCRLYPLGRHVSNGAVTFSVNKAWHPGGIYGEDGTVADFLRAQGAEPFIEAVDTYLALFSRLFGKLEEKLGADARKAVTGGPDSGGGAPEWLDADPVISRYCLVNGIAEPSSFSERMRLHVLAMEEWIKTL